MGYLTQPSVMRITRVMNVGIDPKGLVLGAKRSDQLSYTGSFSYAIILKIAA